MKPDRVLSIKNCKKCDSPDAQIEFFLCSRLQGKQFFLHEKDGFLMRLKCVKCGFFGMQWKETTEDAIYYWNHN